LLLFCDEHIDTGYNVLKKSTLTTLVRLIARLMTAWSD